MCLTDQETKDIAKIMKKFPLSTYVDGALTIIAEICDAESDPVTFVFDGYGNATALTSDIDYIMMDSDFLNCLQRKLKLAKRLYGKWEKSPTCQSWIEQECL
jgi:hypothetical protein